VSMANGTPTSNSGAPPDGLNDLPGTLIRDHGQRNHSWRAQPNHGHTVRQWVVWEACAIRRALDRLTARLPPPLPPTPPRGSLAAVLDKVTVMAVLIGFVLVLLALVVG
jgi:hypothetical protein